MKKYTIGAIALFLGGCIEYSDYGYYDTGYSNPYYAPTTCQTIDYGYMTVDCNGGTYYKNDGSYVSPTYRQNSYGEVYTNNNGTWVRDRSLE